MRHSTMFIQSEIEFMLIEDKDNFNLLNEHITTSSNTGSGVLKPASFFAL